MAAQDVSATGADVQGDVRRRNVGQPNGNYIPKALDEVDEKTKQKVHTHSPQYQFES
jgi:hypothetical protein